MTNTFGGPLEPGRRPAAPLPTTAVRAWFVVGRGAAGLRPGTSQPTVATDASLSLILRFTQDDTSGPLSHGMRWLSLMRYSGKASRKRVRCFSTSIHA